MRSEESIMLEAICNALHTCPVGVQLEVLCNIDFEALKEYGIRESEVKKLIFG